MPNSLASLFRYFPLLRQLFQIPDEDGFDQVLEPLMQQAITHLEGNVALYYRLGEVNLTNVFCACLSMPGLVVTPEGYNNGHVDILIRSTGNRWEFRRLAEAKIYHGPAYHLDGMAQLFGYCTGREPSAYMIEYVKDVPIQTGVDNLKDRLNADRPLNQQGQSVNHPDINWAFVTNHIHRTGANIRVLHLNASIPE